MKVLFQNDTSETIYIGWTDYNGVQSNIKIPSFLSLSPKSEIIIKTNTYYYLTVISNNHYLFDCKISTASKVVICEYITFHYGFNTDEYQVYNPHIRYGHGIHTWMAHQFQGLMMEKLKIH